MYKLTTKTGSLVFTTIEDLMIFVVSKMNDEHFIEISYLEDNEE